MTSIHVNAGLLCACMCIWLHGLNIICDGYSSEHVCNLWSNQKQMMPTSSSPPSVPNTQDINHRLSHHKKQRQEISRPSIIPRGIIHPPLPYYCPSNPTLPYEDEVHWTLHLKWMSPGTITAVAHRLTAASMDCLSVYLSVCVSVCLPSSL